MVLEENWAVAPQRILDFFSELDDCLPTAQGYSFGSCSVTITPMQGQIGSIPIVRSLIRFDGPEDQVRAIYQQFFLRFLSAGG